MKVFFESQRETIGVHDVFSGSYGECVQHIYLRDSVENITYYWNDNSLVIEVHADESLLELPLETFSIPLSVMVD